MKLNIFPLLLFLVTANVDPAKAYVGPPATRTKAASVSPCVSTTQPTATALNALPIFSGVPNVQFADVVAPTYLGSAMAYLSYQMHQNPDYARNLIISLENDPKMALRKVAIVACIGLVSVPVVAGIHTLACSLAGVGATAVDGTTMASVDIASTETAIPPSEVVFPISFALATAFISYQVDRDSDYVVNLWNKLKSAQTRYSMEFADVTEMRSVLSPIVPTEHGNIMDTPVVLASEQIVEKDKTVEVTVVEKTYIDQEQKTTPREKVAKAVKTLFWSEDENSKRRKVTKFVGVLYFPWLPMFLPRNKKGGADPKQQTPAMES
eukprot:scaffold233_cov81-Cylindrotheca_fusiformis.AAC.6